MHGAMAPDLLKTPFLIFLSLFVPGICWGWVFFTPRQTGKLLKQLSAFVCTASTGMCISAMVCLATGHLGVFSSKNLVLSLGLLSAAGLLPALATDSGKTRLKSMLANLPVLAVVFFTACAGVGAMKHTGEWIAGGWDPGVYQNAGISAAINGTFTPEDNAFGQNFSAAEKSFFMRYPSNRTERFPGILSAQNNSRINFHFFHFTPSLTALFYKCGGINAALKTNFYLAVLAVIFTFAAATRMAGVWAGVVAGTLLVFNPVFVYHAHTPVAEMAEMAILTAILFLLKDRNKHPVQIALLMACGVMNKFTFLPFGALLVLLCAFADARAPITPKRKKPYLKNQLIMSLGLCAGAAADFYTSWISVTGWHVLDKILTASGLCLLGAFALSALGKHIRRINLNSPKLTPLFTASVMLPLIIWFASPTIFPNSTDSVNLIRYISYTGYPLFAASLAGMLVFVYMRKRQNTQTKITFIYLACVSALLFTHKFIVPVYPWATRRFLSFTLELSCLLAGFAFATGINWAATLKKTHAQAVKTVLLLLVALCVVAPMGKTRRALQNTEYNGLWNELRDLADHIDSSTLVVADHFWYATPLAIIFGKQVLNGERIHCRRGRHNFEKAMDALRQTAQSGRKVVFLTSTNKGTDIYPGKTTTGQIEYKSQPKKFSVVAHHPKLNDYVSKSINTVFSIYRFE